MAEQKATNITWHEGSVTRPEREKLLGFLSSLAAPQETSRVVQD